MRIIIVQLIFFSVVLLSSACNNDKNGGAQIIEKAIRAANIGDTVTADSCLSKLDKPEMNKTFSGKPQNFSTFIDWRIITGNNTVKRLAVTKFPTVKMTEGVIYEVMIYYETGIGRMKLTTLKENGEWKITFVKMHQITEYITWP